VKTTIIGLLLVVAVMLVVMYVTYPSSLPKWVGLAVVLIGCSLLTVAVVLLNSGLLSVAPVAKLESEPKVGCGQLSESSLRLVAYGHVAHESPAGVHVFGSSLEGDEGCSECRAVAAEYAAASFPFATT